MKPSQNIQGIKYILIGATIDGIGTFIILFTFLFQKGINLLELAALPTTPVKLYTLGAIICALGISLILRGCYSIKQGNKLCENTNPTQH